MRRSSGEGLWLAHYQMTALNHLHVAPDALQCKSQNTQLLFIFKTRWQAFRNYLFPYKCLPTLSIIEPSYLA